MRIKTVSASLILAFLLLLTPLCTLASTLELTTEPETGAELSLYDSASYAVTVTEAWPRSAADSGPCTVRVELGAGMLLDMESVQLVRIAQPLSAEETAVQTTPLPGETPVGNETPLPGETLGTQTEKVDYGLEQFIFGNDGFVLIADRLDVGDKILFCATAVAEGGECTTYYRNETQAAEYTILAAEDTTPAPEQPMAAAAVPETAKRDLTWLIWVGTAVLLIGIGVGAFFMIRRIGKVRKHTPLDSYLAAIDQAQKLRFGKR